MKSIINRKELERVIAELKPQLGWRWLYYALTRKRNPLFNMGLDKFVQRNTKMKFYDIMEIDD